MTEPLVAAILLCGDEDMAAVISLMMLQISEPIHFLHYHTPSEIGAEVALDLAVVSRLPCLKDFIKLFEERGKPIPLMIHLVHPRLLNEIDYQDLFDCDCRIIAVPQASLDVMDVTLKYERFNKAVEEARQRKSAVQRLQEENH